MKINNHFLDNKYFIFYIKVIGNENQQSLFG